MKTKTKLRRTRRVDWWVAKVIQVRNRPPDIDMWQEFTSEKKARKFIADDAVKYGTASPFDVIKVTYEVKS